MSIESLSNVLSFLDISAGYFVITAGNNTLLLTSDVAGPQTISITDGTYSGASLATALQTAMNADTTLTGGGIITFAVAYSSTTSKFTIDAGVTHTIAYTHAGSSAGITFGFTVSVTAAQTITSDTASGDPTTLVQMILTDVESYVSNYCNRVFESTSYLLERYNGRGYQTINLRQYPVTVVDRVAVGTLNAIEIRNTNTGTSASVSVKPTGLRLVLNGIADETILFAAVTTIGAVVTAVNNLANGWAASISDSTYSTFKSTDLITQSASSCINNSIVYLSIPNTAEPEVDVDLGRGQIVLNYGFAKGNQNVFVDYTAGYSSTNMPPELKLAVKIIVQYIYEKAKNNVFGIGFYNIGASGSTGLRTIFEIKNVMPKEAEQILGRYKRRLL